MPKISKLPLSKRLITWFNEVNKNDVGLVGGKGANLGEMTQAGFPVPNGFILTSNAYFHYIKINRLQPKIKRALSVFDRHQPDQLFKASKEVKNIILKGDFPKKLAQEVFKYYESVDKSSKNPYVAVRSSATAEDLPDASFAGQQETFLNVKGEASLIVKIKEAYASLFTPRAIFYREEKGFDHFNIGIAVPVQLMIESDVSGVMFTVDPVTNDKKTMVIESIWGLGEYIVQGIITPDQYLLRRRPLKIIKKTKVKQVKQFVLKAHKNVERSVPKNKQTKIKISDSMILEIAKLGKKIHQHYFFPQDIEWGIKDEKLYLLQTRPITTLKIKKKKVDKKVLKHLKLLIKGDGASPGIVSGYAVLIKSPKQISKVKSGDILVTSMTSPDFVPAMKRAAAIITDKGGLTSHAAIVSRELGVPCVVGTQKASKIIKAKQVLSVNGTTGEVFVGGVIKPENVRQNLWKKGKSDESIEDMVLKNTKTATKLMVNLADPDTADEIAARNVDGVGLLRAEFIMAQLKDHPRKIIADKKQKKYIKTIAENIAVFCKSFHPRPVIYRTADFKSNEYSHLKGGAKYEPKEENPMLGWRGVTRYIHDEAVFELELAAINLVRKKMNLRNLWVMLPFVRTVPDLKLVKKILGASGIIRSPSFKLFMMCEIPSNVILLEDFIKVGIDGVSIGSNDLTMLTLGVDRDSANLSGQYSEMDPAVLWSLERVIKICQKQKILCSICGEAPSNYAQLVNNLVKWGISSISVSPDAIERTRKLIINAETEMLKSRV